MSKSYHYAKPLPKYSNDAVSEGLGEAGTVAAYHYSFMPTSEPYSKREWQQGNTPPVIGPFLTRKACDSFIESQNKYLKALYSVDK